MSFPRLGVKLTFSSALSATAPFPQLSPRLRLVAVLGPAFLASILTSCYVFMKLSTLSIGLAFFGDPIIRRGIVYLNRRLPNWQKLVQLQKYVSSRACTHNANSQ